MTTLRSFQTEIDEIHNREVSKQRALGTTILEKENKAMKGKAKEDPATPSAKQEPPDNVESDTRSMDEDEQILVCVSASFNSLDQLTMIKKSCNSRTYCSQRTLQITTRLAIG